MARTSIEARRKSRVNPWEASPCLSVVPRRAATTSGRPRRPRAGAGPNRAQWARAGMTMGIPLDLLSNAIVAGLLLGGFYAAVTAGISISFGMLDIVNIAHPAFIIMGSYVAY